MHLFHVKHFYAGPSAKRKHSATGPLSRTKGLLPAQETKNINLWESTDPSACKVFFHVWNHEFQALGARSS